jgi:hypothetical protein
MTSSSAGTPDEMKEAKLPRRDWILLPLISLLTIASFAGATEMIARLMFSHSATSLYDCLVLSDPTTGTRGIPGCTCWEKIEENQPVEYRLNSSGYRAGMEFGPKSADTYRIVMVGSSFAMGYRVEREKTFGALLPPELSQRAGRKTELYNEAMGGSGGSPRSVSLRFNDALGAKPDMILWIITPWDIAHVSTIMPDKVMPVSHAVAMGTTKRLIAEALAKKSVPEVMRALSDVPLNVLRNRWEATRSSFLLQHFLNEGPSQYLKSYLMQPDSSSGFLRAEPSAQWQSWLRQTDVYAADLAARAKAAGVPLVAALVPDRAEATMISMGEWPGGIDPYKLGNELRAIVVSRAGIYIDILPGYRSIPNPEEYYFAVDGHPTADGQKIISGLIAEALTGGAVRALSIATRPQAATARAR